MSVSLFGIIWSTLILICINNRKRMLLLLLLSTVIQASYVMVVAGFDINAMLVTSIAFIIQHIFQNSKIGLSRKWMTMIVYSLYLIVVSVAAPLAFSGHTVVGMTNNEYDFGLTHIETIQLSGKNLSQPLAIFLYVVVALIVYQNREKYSLSDVKKYIRFVFYFVLVTGFIHELIMFLGLSTNMYQMLIHNEADIIGNTFVDRYYIGRYVKFFSTFYEPSYCGAYLAAMLGFFLIDNGKKRKQNILLCVVAIMLNMCSTGLVCAVFVIIVYAIIQFKNGNLSMNKMIVFFLAIISFVAIIGFVPSIRNLVFEYTIRKTASGSFAIRTFVDGIAFKEFIYTKGIGLGLNSIQCYSLWATLLSQAGIIGTILYIFFNKKIIHKLGSSKLLYSHCVVLMLITVYLAQLLSIQALNFCTYWLVIWLAMAVIDNKKWDGNINA